MQAKNESEPLFKLTPAIANYSWRFGDLSAAELMPILQHHLMTLNIDSNRRDNWQLVWLNNDNNPIIGLLPKVSWQVYANDKTYKNATEQTLTYKIIIHHRDTQDNQPASTSEYLSYIEWQQRLIAYSKDFDRTINLDRACINSTEPLYTQGLIGFIGYDIAAHELSANANIQQAVQPHAVLGHYDIYMSLRPSHTDESVTDTKQWILNIRDNGDAHSTLSDHLKNQLIKSLIALDLKLSKSKIESNASSLILTAKWQKSDYSQAFKRTQNYLKDGDCYQINLTQVWQGVLTDAGSAQKSQNAILKLIDYLPALQRDTQAPFAGYLAVESSDKFDANKNDINFELLSCSPELFFTFIRDEQTVSHHIRTKPIKGTMPRGSTDAQDNVLKQHLIDSEKDRSENVMIVDLLRNDLGKYAKTGSVKVPQLFAIESFSNVHHMVSTITAELKVDTHPLSVLFGSLPAGSITGTPKKRAVEIISELEVAARGAYCGTMGYMNFDGSGQWNVLIRTLQASIDADNKKQISLWAGGGITIASECASEYQECLDKVGNLLAVLAKT